MTNVNRQVVFDLGMNNGDDAHFYLRKGFRVVAVEANSTLCELARKRFADEIAANRLCVINGAIAAKSGEVSFYLHDTVTGWSTTQSEWLEARTETQREVHRVMVSAVTLPQLIETYGVPYYLKADIQGAEAACLKGLLEARAFPKFISVSAGTDVLRRRAMQHARALMELLIELGYDAFQIVGQSRISGQCCPFPAREGVYFDHRFPHGSSGLFGRELEGPWLSASEAYGEHRWIAWSYRLAGHSRSPAGWLGWLPAERIKYGLDRLFWRGLDWYDLHATRRSFLQ